MRKLLVTLGTATAMMVLAACGSGGSESSADGSAGGSNAAVESLSFLFPVGSVIQYHPWYVAQEKGWFEEEGVNVDLQVGDGSSGILQQLLAGNADAVLPSPGAFLTAVDTGRDIRMIYQYQYSNIFSLAVPDSSNINAIEDLLGKAVGVSELSGGEVPLVRAVLRDAGLEEGSDVDILEVGEGSALAVKSLQDGRIAAYSSNLFDVATVEVNGNLPMTNILPESVQQFPANGVVVTADTLKNNGDAITKMLRAVARAVAWSEQYPDEAKAIAKKVAPEEFEDAELADAAWEAATVLKTPTNSDDPLGTPYLAGWEEYYEFLQQGTREEGAVSADIDLGTVLDTSLLAAVNDFDPTADEK